MGPRLCDGDLANDVGGVHAADNARHVACLGRICLCCDQPQLVEHAYLVARVQTKCEAFNAALGVSACDCHVERR